jgi:hypothetical protein
VNSAAYLEAEIRNLHLEMEEITNTVNYYSVLIDNAVQRAQEINQIIHSRVAEITNQNRGGMYE